MTPAELSVMRRLVAEVDATMLHDRAGKPTHAAIKVTTEHTGYCPILSVNGVLTGECSTTCRRRREVLAAGLALLAEHEQRQAPLWEAAS